jgi:hypothetical protein
VISPTPACDLRGNGSAACHCLDSVVRVFPDQPERISTNCGCPPVHFRTRVDVQLSDQPPATTLSVTASRSRSAVTILRIDVGPGPGSSGLALGGSPSRQRVANAQRLTSAVCVRREKRTGYKLRHREKADSLCIAPRLLFLTDARPPLRSCLSDQARHTLPLVVYLLLFLLYHIFFLSPSSPPSSLFSLSRPSHPHHAARTRYRPGFVHHTLPSQLAGGAPPARNLSLNLHHKPSSYFPRPPRLRSPGPHHESRALPRTLRPLRVLRKQLKPSPHPPPLHHSNNTTPATCRQTTPGTALPTPPPPTHQPTTLFSSTSSPTRKHTTHQMPVANTSCRCAPCTL